jgi:hypothetical protein
MELYFHTPIHLHDMVLKNRDNFDLKLGEQVIANKLEGFIKTGT